MLALPLVISACGYRFVGYQVAGEPQKNISIITLRNDSEEPGIELLASEALRHEVLSRGGLSLHADPRDADFVLRGRVLPVRTRSRSFTGVVLAREYEVTVKLELQVDPQRGQPGALSSTVFSASEIYLASADSAVLRKNRLEALRYLCGLLASRVHDAIDRSVLDVVP